MCPSTKGRTLDVCRFNRALVRLPAGSVVDGLRAEDRGNPTYEGICAEHDAYVAALRAAGVEATILPPLEAFPDSMFVEDPALLFTQGAILLRPGTPSRAAEAAELAPTLRDLFEVVIELPSGFADGGDVLVTPDRVMIGLSERTDRAGAEALVDCLAQLGRGAMIVETPDDVLHLKSACSLLDDETMLCTPGLAATGIFDGFRQMTTADGEAGAANALRVNDVVLAGAGFPRTIERLDALGYAVVPIATQEIGKIDAGLSCMSLRWFSGST
ncbi:MAG: arginine deiminase family protein [Sphingomicrobium sp.]